jgi:hypothetical protein
MAVLSNNQEQGDAMNRTVIVLLASLGIAVPHAIAADALTAGKYSGGYDVQTRTGPGTVGLDLDIKEIDGSKVKAVAVTTRNGACNGEYPMAGTYKDGKLTLKATQRSGSGGDCNLAFTANVEGSKLVGKTSGGRALTLTR